MNKTNETEGLTPTLAELIERIRYICVKSGVASLAMGEICHEVRHSELSASSLRIEELEKELREAQMRARNADHGPCFRYADSLKALLRPFSHDDLCEALGGNVEGDDSPVFGRGGAVLRLKHFRGARDALSYTADLSAAESAESRVAHLEGVIRELVSLYNMKRTFSPFTVQQDAEYTVRSQIAWTAASQSLHDRRKGVASRSLWDRTERRAEGNAAEPGIREEVIEELRRRVRLIEVQNEGCGGNLSDREIVSAMQRECRSTLAFIDALAGKAEGGV